MREGADPAKKEPRSFVFRRGRHAALLKDLEKDLRHLLAPNTAAALKESRRNQMKDFVAVAGPLGVTHFAILTATQSASYLRLARAPRGPTLTMRIHSYSLMRDVVAAQQRPRLPEVRDTLAFSPALPQQGLECVGCCRASACPRSVCPAFQQPVPQTTHPPPPSLCSRCGRALR